MHGRRENLAGMTSAANSLSDDRDWREAVGAAHGECQLSGMARKPGAWPSGSGSATGGSCTASAAMTGAAFGSKRAGFSRPSSFCAMALSDCVTCLQSPQSAARFRAGSPALPQMMALLRLS
jgi:hypothetical protein